MEKKNKKKLECLLLQILLGALRVNQNKYLQLSNVVDTSLNYLP